MNKIGTDQYLNQMKIQSIPYIDKNFIPNSTINKKKVDLNNYMYNHYDSTVLNNSFYENIYNKYNKLNENMKKKKMTLIDVHQQEKKENSKIKENPVENEGKVIMNNILDKKYPKIKTKQNKISSNNDENIIVKGKIPVKDTILPRKTIKKTSKIKTKSPNIMKTDNLIDNSIKRIMSNSIVKANSPNKKSSNLNSPKKSSFAKLLNNIDKNANKEEEKDNDNVFSLSKERMMSLKSKSDVNEKSKNKNKNIFCCF